MRSILVYTFDHVIHLALLTRGIAMITGVTMLGLSLAVVLAALWWVFRS